MSIHSINKSAGKKSNSQKLFLLHIIVFLIVSDVTLEKHLKVGPSYCVQTSFWEVLTESRVDLMLEILSMKKVLNLSDKCSVGVLDGSSRVLCLAVKLLKIELKKLELED